MSGLRRRDFIFGLAAVVGAVCFVVGLGVFLAASETAGVILLAFSAIFNSISLPWAFELAYPPTKR